ncbi:MAG: hypothetical protein NTX82_04130 [Candidatus Parcubacteria bacterium]|nr:hypothetical protein [Candidatus Parcubacteria bacterium]
MIFIIQKAGDPSSVDASPSLADFSSLSGKIFLALMVIIASLLFVHILLDQILAILRKKEAKMRGEDNDGCGCLGWILTFFLLVMFGLIGLTVSFDMDTGKDQIIYDRQAGKILTDLSFSRWFMDRGKYGDRKQYFFIPEQAVIMGVTANVSFKAKLTMPRSGDAVRRFVLRQAKVTADEDLFKAQEACVASVIRIPNRVENYPDIAVRAWSISNMDFHCPLAAEFGYQWNGNLEIAQCFSHEIKDSRDKGLCVELVRGRE